MFKNIFFRLLLLLGCGLVLVNVAYAENRFSVAPGRMYFDYEETADDGAFLDGETGTADGATVTLERDLNSSVTGLIFGSIYSGTVDYDGHTQAGDPIRTDTQADFFTLGFEAKMPVKNATNDLSIVAGYRFKRWERDIQSVGIVSGLYEIYQWQEAALGVQLDLKDTDRGRWRVFGGLFKTHNAEIKIDLVDEGYGEPKLSLGSDTGVELSLQWMMMSSNNQRFGFDLSCRAWKFGRSPNEISSGPSGSVIIHEPRSVTSIILLEFVFEVLN